MNATSQQPMRKMLIRTASGTQAISMHIDNTGVAWHHDSGTARETEKHGSRLEFHQLGAKPMNAPARKREKQGRSQFPGDTGAATARRQVIWLTALLVLVSGLGVIVALAVLRGEALHTGERLNESLAHVIEEQTNSTLLSADLRLQLAASRLDALDAAGDLNAESGRAMLREQLEGLPFMRSIWVLDRDGAVAYDAEPGTRGLDVSDREYFSVYKKTPSRGFHVSAPVRSRVTGRWVISASRPLRDALGNVTGVVVAGLEPPYFDKLWRQIDPGMDGTVTLFRRDGTVMMRTPVDEAAIGRNVSDMPLFRRYLPLSPHGTNKINSVFDGKQRVSSYRTLAGYPDLVVAVGRSFDEILGPWWRFAWLAGSIWLAAAVVVGLLSFMLYRQITGREHTELLFRRLAQAMPQIVFITNANGRLVFLSDQWSQVTGRPVAEGLDKGWLHWVHPDDRDSAIEIIRRTLETGESEPSEHRMLTSDGQHRWVLSRAVANRDAAGRIVSWYGTSTDIDDLKQAEAALKQQAELIGMAGRLSRLGGWAVEVPSMRFRWSEEASEILQLPPGSAPSLENALALCAPESREAATRAAEECLAEGTPFDMEVRMLTPAGLDIICRSMGRAIYDENGAITGMQGAFQDVTARVRAEAENRAYLQTLQRAGEAAQVITQQRSLPDMLQQVADQSRMVIGARRCVVTVAQGESAPPLVTESVASDTGLPPASREWLTATITSRDGVGIGQLRLSGKYEGEFNRHDEYVANDLAQLASIGIDNVNLIAQVTELNTGLEERIARRTAELQRSNAELEAFSYSVSHDLRSPLSSVDGFSRLLLRELDGHHGEKVRHYLQRIQAGASQMGNLIDGLLSLAHLSRIEMRQTAVDLSVLAGEILERLQAQSPDRHVAFSVEPGLRVTGDARLLRSLLENLLGNAWKFSGRVDVAEIAVGLSALHGAYFVRDNGAGFDMAYAAKLFGTFQRLHDAADFPGTGVGLATVARIVSRHGGRIWAESAPGRGTTFYFTLPGV
ncbi:MAG: PAS domain S-box protein [Comamonadaceae bacterium]|nr:MAG: PAS domain S-box protein [Comamonadaceae bacterium]